MCPSLPSQLSNAMCVCHRETDLGRVFTPQTRADATNQGLLFWVGAGVWGAVCPAAPGGMGGTADGLQEAWLETVPWVQEAREPAQRCVAHAGCGHLRPPQRLTATPPRGRFPGPPAPRTPAPRLSSAPLLGASPRACPENLPAEL